MERKESMHACSVAVQAAFGVLGKRWNGMILEVLREGPLSYVEVRRGVGGISDATLSERLVELAAAGLVDRAVTDGPPLSVTYSLTPSGARLKPILDDLGAWAQSNLEAPATPE